MAGAEITQNDLKDMQDRLARATSQSHKLLAIEVWGNIRQNAPQDHGRLAGSFTLSGGDTESVVGSAVEYAAVQEEGRGPYRIYPKNGPRMVFQINGSWVTITDYIDHPGIPAKKYIARSIEDAQRRVPDFVTTALRQEGLA